MSEPSETGEKNPDKETPFLSRKTFLALPYPEQIKKIEDLQVWAADMRNDPKIKADFYADARLYNASAERSPVSSLEKIPAGEERAAQAYRYYYACQDALTHGEKALNGTALAERQADPDGNRTKTGSASTKSTHENSPEGNAPPSESPSSERRSRTERGEEGGRQKRSPEERLARLTKLQDRTATALADGSASTWTEEQRAAAEKFTHRDLSQDILNRETRQDIRSEAKAVREGLQSGGVGPANIRMERHRQQQPDTAGAQSEDPSQRVGNREHRFERLERLQNRVREAMNNGTTDGWTHAQQAHAANFANRDLRAEARNPQSRQEIRAEAQELRGLLRQERGNSREIDPVAAFSSATANHAGWNDRTAGPEPETTYRDVSVHPTAPRSVWSSGYNDQTRIPETQTASYDLSFSGPARRAFAPAAAGAYYVAPRNVPLVGSYERELSSGIRWNGGPLRNSFAPQAGYDPGPPPGWRPGMPVSYANPSSHPVRDLLGATAVVGLGHMDRGERHELRVGLREAGFGWHPVQNALHFVLGG
ncbi:MAG: hypothetical protein H6862_02270 [Rhodospirillales bacterium]|nr:hypothetical protein [Rhodospirillales bacterium]